MGVPRRENTRSIRIEDCVDGQGEHHNYHNYDLSESGDEINAISRRISVEQLHPLRSKNAKKTKMGRPPHANFNDIDTDGVNVKRNMGMKKWRRVEHARIMLTFTDLEDICEDGSDIATPPTTAFDKLFADEENMKLWNEFCAKDETEQRRILNEKSKLQKTENTPTTSKGVGSKEIFSCSGNSTNNKSLKRFSPFSGSACFDRIDPKSRMVLLGRKVNWAFIDFLERELREVFKIDGRNEQDTKAVFIGSYPASSDRLLAHIVAQWLGLKSISSTEPRLGERITEIRNHRPLIPPQTTLIAHLEGRVLKRDIAFVPFSLRDGQNVKAVKHDEEEQTEEPSEDGQRESEEPEDADTSFVLADELDEPKISLPSSPDSADESWEKVPKQSDA